MRKILITCLLAVTASPAGAQMYSRTADAPTVSAVGQSWYELREPIIYAGEAYYPAGAAVAFNGYQMVRTGHFNGVPVYSDATRDPYSVVYVPIGGGQLKPYERRRIGALAGSVGTTSPSFPISLRPDQPTSAVAMSATAPSNLPYSLGAISVFTPETTPPLVLVPAVATASAAPVCSCDQTAPSAVATAAPLPAERVISVRRPDNNDGVWIRFDGSTWVSTGVAEPRTTAFTQVGDLGGFAVYRKQDGGTIYLESRDGVLAPYRRKS